MDRKKLGKVNGQTCNDSLLKIFGMDSLVIRITTTRFNSLQHRLSLTQDSLLIDGKFPYGTDGNIPNYSVKAIDVQWGKHRLVIPDSAFSDLYELNLCEAINPVEVYYSANRQYFYIYITASDASSSYAVKFIFNRKQYLTRIISRNECADPYDFLDGTADCED